MTTIEPTFELPTRVRADGSTQTGASAAQVESSIREARKRDHFRKFIVQARGEDGTGTYGLYLEVVNETPGHESHYRYFVVGPNIYASSRSKGMTKANWRHRKVESVEKVLSFLDGVLTRPEVKLFGRPLLVELEADSVSQIEADQMPAARFRGQYRVERDFGKYEFGQVIVAEEFPPDFPLPR